ncbi:probable phospholipid-transporting ATPase IF isoform X1 [Orbicella faveolata]|uniref:probable phospholipid-transporting ATPase IF isoform X1 n=1 Tax=Orbicella faveolata TaxID=48498 RepID=UPI0009E4A15F|nr:probable phospholipid-transporting ATPase IF isoform X1 [Orbicella faveolata]
MSFGRLKNRLLGFLPGRRRYEDEWRTVYVLNKYPSDEPDVEVKQKRYANNVIVTSKYTIWNFLPKNLFEQFRRIANFYFLCIGVIQLLIDSPVSPVTSILPLVFVITVTAIKQGYEDWLRHKADREVNNRPTNVIREGTVRDIPSKNVKVGDIVQVLDDEEIPCDLVVMSCDDAEGTCYITTANLDGETNLKVRNALSDTAGLQSAEQLSHLTARVECQHPQEDLYSFSGRMIITPRGGGEPVVKALGPQNLLLRGARLKNSTYTFGVAVYTGRETKMALNQQQGAHKFSTVEKTMNVFLIVFLVVLLCQGALCAGLMFWKQNSRSGTPSYVYLEKPKVTFTGSNGVLDTFLVFLILFNYVIPISLYVTVELQKFIGALFFAWDVKMYMEETDERAIANTSDLNEELGQIEYVFTDKTGTLTENDMQFRECSINGLKYVELNSQLFVADQTDGPCVSIHTVNSEVMQFFLTLSLCHTVQASKETGHNSIYDYHYQASSPDEKALVEAAVRFGVTYQGKVGDDIEVRVDGLVERYTLLHVLEFDSTRKRMSVIVKSPKDEYVMLVKGAETAVLDQLASGPRDITLDHVNEYAVKGLRTLAVARRVLSEDEYVIMDRKLNQAKQAINDREEQLARVYEEVERDLHVLGATAVEDRLQDGVPDTIAALRDAGIKVWVLTGDKEETAVNISHSCGHFKTGMEIMFVTKKQSERECEEELVKCRDRLFQSPPTQKTPYGVVIDGISLAHVFKAYTDLFVDICRECVAVLCCRMSPLQKAQIVQLMKCSREKPVTLAIGDGANDCGMIQEAHVGIGVMGKEGRQAVRTSDYAVARFKFLLRVLLVHGHWYYVRAAILVQYFFYKNVCFITPQFFYAFFTAFSGQPLYHAFFLTAYNIFFTSLPILVYGIFEQHVNSDALQSQPRLYRDIRKNYRLSWTEFFFWVFSGYWHALVFFFGSYFFFQGDTLGPAMWQYGNWSFGTFVFTVCVIVSNLKLALVTHYWTWMSHVSTWGSIVLFFLSTITFNSETWKSIQLTFSDVISLDMYKLFFTLFSQGVVWLALVLLILMALLPDIVFMLIGRHFHPSETQKVQAGTAAEGRDSLVAAVDTNAILSNGTSEVSTQSDVSLIELTGSNASDLATWRVLDLN